MLTETLRGESLPTVVPPAELASPGTAADPIADPVIVRRRRSLAIPLLLLLTLIGGGLRFLSLDKPTIWGDEAATYGRVAGTYQDLLDQLWDSSFPPLHYETLWWIGQGMPYWGHTVPRPGQPADVKEPLKTFEPTKFLVPGGIRLTPFFMRLIPAIAGTLFIPALYFLTRQLFGPRVSLLAAFLACFSAYLLVYSRDGKMYMPFWTLCVTNVGCLLWWLRTRRTLPWLMWVVSGTAMIGWHASGFMLLAIDGVFFFTSPRLHWRKLTTVTGIFAWPILVGPLYGLERLRRRFEWRDGLRWQAFFGWPRRAAATFVMPAILPFALGLIVMLSTMFGPYGFYSSFDRVYHQVSEDNRTAVDISSLGIDWVGRYNAGRELSGYLLYTGSAYLTGWEWPRHLPGMGLDDQKLVYPRTLRLLQVSTATLMILLAVGVVPWRKAFSRSRARLDRMRQERLVAPPYRRRRVLWLAIWLMAIPWIAYTQSTQRPNNVLDGFASIVLKNPPSPRWPRARLIPQTEPAPLRTEDAAWPRGVVDFARAPVLDLRDGIVSRWAVIRQSWAEIKKAWPMEWKTYTNAFQSGNYSIAGIAIASTLLGGLLILTIWKWRSLGRGTVELALVLGAMVVIGTPLALLPRWLDNDVWMPRYLGVVMPAFFIVVAVLLARQPTRWLPAVTLSLFVIVNLSQFAARVYGQSEPPTDRMAADIIASQSKSTLPQSPAVPTFRAYTDFPIGTVAEPGGSTIFNVAGRYYLHVLSGMKEHGREVRMGQFEQNLQTWRFSNADQIQQDLKHSPAVQKIVVWNSVPAFEIDQSDPIAERLAGTFRKVSDDLWQVADHWRWVQHPQVRRRVYEKIATTRPVK